MCLFICLRFFQLAEAISSNNKVEKDRVIEAVHISACYTIEDVLESIVSLSHTFLYLSICLYFVHAYLNVHLIRIHSYYCLIYPYTPIYIG